VKPKQLPIHNDHNVLSIDCKNNNLFRSFEVRRFLCLFSVSPAFENNLSLGTEVATVDKYFNAIFDKIG